MAMTGLFSCASGKKDAQVITQEDVKIEEKAIFDADSAYSYMSKQVSFGPRVPNTDAHVGCGEYLTSELKRHGAKVYLQEMNLTAFDGTKLKAKNIMGSYNPDAADRLLLLAHWDTRPWSDNDPDEQNHNKANLGANDGASGVGVLLEICRQLNSIQFDKGVDILFVDAEDWGTEGDEESWAMGARYFAQNPIYPGYAPQNVILLDMVGGKDAKFMREYHSQRYAPELTSEIWQTAAQSGYSDRFINEIGGAITDDHVEFIKEGYPAIDIIEYNSRSGTGFNPTWHTQADNMDGIDKSTLKAVGQTILNYILK